MTGKIMEVCESNKKSKKKRLKTKEANSTKKDLINAKVKMSSD